MENERMKMIAGRIATIANQFGPDSQLYDEAVERSRKEVADASTRDDLSKLVDRLERLLTPHLMDDHMEKFHNVVTELRGTQEPWPVEAFKEGYLEGSGQQLPEDGQAAGRKLNSDHIQ